MYTPRSRIHVHLYCFVYSYCVRILNFSPPSTPSQPPPVYLIQAAYMPTPFKLFCETNVFPGIDVNTYFIVLQEDTHVFFFRMHILGKGRGQIKDKSETFTEAFVTT